jgi:hypothetical protein
MQKLGPCKPLLAQISENRIETWIGRSAWLLTESITALRPALHIILPGATII